MGVQPTDLLLIERAGTAYKAHASDLVKVEGFDGRAALVTHIATNGAVAGQSYFADGLGWRAVPVGHVLFGINPIPDLPGLLPLNTPHFRHYGAAGDNSTDDTAACQAALTAHPTEFVDGEGLTYRIDGTLSGVKIRNAKFRKVGAGSVFTAWGSTETPISPAVSPARGDTTITSGAMAPLLSEGDWFAVTASNNPYAGFMAGTMGGQSGELVQVKEISGSVISITKPLFWVYTTTERLHKINWLRGVELVNVDIEGDPAANPGTFDGGGELIDLRFCMRPRLINVTGHDNKMAVVMTHCCVGMLIEGGGAWELGSETTPGGGQGTGYGVHERGMNEGAIITGCRWNRIRTGYTTGAGLSSVWPYGVPTNTLVVSNHSNNAKQSGMSTHEAGLFQHFAANIIDGALAQGINLRAKYATVTKNKITRSVGPGVLLINDGVDSIAEGSTVENNVIEFSNYGTDPSGVDQTATGAINDNTPSSVIRGNIIRKCGGPGLRLNFTQQVVAKGNIIIDPCQFSGTHGVVYAIGAASAGAGSPLWLVDQNTVISTDGLCTTFLSKPDGVVVKGSANTGHGLPILYAGENLNTDLQFTGRPNFGGRDADETIVGGVLALNALSVTGSIITLRAESGTADDLNTITGGVEGDEIILRALAGHTITVVNGAGSSTNNLRTNTGGNLAMTYGTGNEKLYRFVKFDNLWVRTS